MHARLTCMLALVALRAALYESGSKVLAVSDAMMRGEVARPGRVWLVEFYAPWCGHCQSLAPEYEKVARALEGVVAVGAINADEHKEAAGTYGIRGFPTIKLFGLKPAPIDYEGQRTAAAIVEFVLAQLGATVRARAGISAAQSQKPRAEQRGALVELSEASFAAQVTAEQSWLVMFYAPWCGHCKSAMPDFEGAAADAGPVRFGRVNCEENRALCGKYEVRGYPTIKLFSGGEHEPYEGARSRQAFAEFALSKARAPPQKLELAQLQRQQTFDAYCVEFDGLCLIAFLPDLRDSGEAKRAAYLTDLAELRAANARNRLSFLWASGGEQLALENALNMNFGYPSLVAVHHKKKKYSIMRKRFDKESIAKFVSDLVTGDAVVADLPPLPAVKPFVAPKPTQEDL